MLQVDEKSVLISKFMKQDPIASIAARHLGDPYYGDHYN
jgi:hypothetical protein